MSEHWLSSSRDTNRPTDILPPSTNLRYNREEPPSKKESRGALIVDNTKITWWKQMNTWLNFTMTVLLPVYAVSNSHLSTRHYKQSLNHSLSHSINHSINKSINEPITQSLNQPNKKTVVKGLKGFLSPRPLSFPSSASMRENWTGEGKFPVGIYHVASLSGYRR